MTATAVASSYEAPVRAEIYDLDIASVHPDPAQPRLDVDDELAQSIKEHGVLQSIEVRPHPTLADSFQIVDGERRWRGARKAGLKTIPATITFEVEGINLGDRMIRQIVRNDGKPLTAVEEALAFRKIIDAKRADRVDESGKVVEKGDPKYGPVALARELGTPKSTVTDRLAATEIPAFWLNLIVKGPLQPSHIPVLHRYRDVPEKYQARALAKMRDEWNWRSRGSERIYIEDFDSMVREAMRPFIRAVSEVPGYKGPTAKIPDPRAGYFSRKKVVVMAMDPTQWEPIYRKQLAAKRAKTAAANKAGGGKAARQQTSWQKQQEERDRQYEAGQARRERFKKARPNIERAFSEKVASAPVRELQEFVLSNYKRESQAVAKLVAVGNTPEQFIRHMAMLEISDMTRAWDAERKTPALGKRFKVDVAAIVKPDAEEKEEKRPDPATTDPGEAGDGLQVAGVHAADEDEDDG